MEQMSFKYDVFILIIKSAWDTTHRQMDMYLHTQKPPSSCKKYEHILITNLLFLVVNFFQSIHALVIAM